MATAMSQTRESRTRLARILLVICDVFPEIMQELLLYSIPPRTLIIMIKKDKTITDNLNTKEQKILQDMYHKGYSDVDVSFAYKLLRVLNLIEDPSQKWGREAASCDVSVSDDVERIHHFRNSVCHRALAEVSEAGLQKHFADFIAIGRRIDQHLHKNPNFGFEKKILSLQTNSIDAAAEEKYINALEEICELKQQLTHIMKNDKTLNIFFDDDFENMIQETNANGGEEGEVGATVIIYGCGNEEKIIERINNLKEILNSGKYTIKLNCASQGCVLLYISIQTKMLKNRKSLLSEVTGLIEDICCFCDVDRDLTATLRLFDVFLDSDDCTRISTRQDAWPLTYFMDAGIQKKNIQLDVGIKTDTLESSTSLRENIIGFLTDVLEIANEDLIPQEQHVIDVILQGKHKDISMIQTKTEEIERSQANVIPKNIMEDTKSLIEEDVREGTFVTTNTVTDGLLLLKQNGVLLITGYAEDTRALIEEDVREDTFVTTKAVTDGLLLLKQNGVLLITGHAGTGKSRIGRHVLHKFYSENKSFKCMKLTLAEWDDMTNKKEKDSREENMDNIVDNFVLLIDDIFGATYCILNREFFLDTIYAYVCKGNINVIITIRDTVKRHCEEMFESHRLFQFDFIDLSSKKYLLSYEEKHTILMKYMKTVRQSDYIKSKGFVDRNGHLILKSNEVSNISRGNPVKGFPLAVYQFVHNNKYFRLGSKFFDRPTEAMLEELNTIRRKGEDHRKFMIQYAVMVYTAINENCITLDDNLNITAVSKISDAIYGEKVKIKKCHISDAVNELKGSYLINIPNQRSYRFHHQTLQESAILSFAQIDEENIKKIIPLISFSFFLKMIKPKSYKQKDEEVVLMIPTNSFKVLADRLADIYIADFSIYHLDTIFLHNLSNTEIFQQEYCHLLPSMIEALEREDHKDKYTENMIRSVVIDTSDYVRSNVHIKNTDLFLAYLLDTVAKSENQLDIYYFVLKIFKTITNTRSSRMTVDYTNFALISSLYVICATKDVRCIKATFDMIEENKIPVLVDQGVILTEVPNITSMSTFGEEYEDETCVFLTLCIWNAYKVFNIPVLEFLLSKYNHTPFDINLFFKMIYRGEWTHNMIPSVRKRVLGRPTLSFEPLKWMIERFPDQELEDPNFIVRITSKLQMFDTVKYLASGSKPISRISCLKALLNKPESFVGIVPFSQELFSFLIKQIDMSSEGLIPFVSSVIQKLDIPDYMFEAFLPVCINNANIFRLACENGQFYLVKLIIESSRQIEHLDIQSALVAACKESEITQHHSFNHEKADDEVAKLEIVKYIVDKIGFHQFDWIAICQQACSTKKIKILEWIVQNIDTTRLDVYTIIDSALVCNRSDILERQMQNFGLESLDKKRILKSVNKLIIDTRIETEHFTAEYHTSILNVLHTSWDSAEVKEVLLMEDIVKTAYARKYFKLLMWIHENCHPHVTIDSTEVLMLACANDRIDVAEWVIRTFEQTSLKVNGGKLLKLACKERFYPKDIRIKDRHLSNDIKDEYWKEVGNKLKSTVNWILQTFEITPVDIISSVRELINVHEKIRHELSKLIESLFESYLSCLNTEDITQIIDKALEQKYYVLVNWFLQKSVSCSIDKQNVLEKACADYAIETIEKLSKYFYTLNLNQAMIKACTSTYSISGEFLHKEESYTEDQPVACLSLLWNEIIKIGHDSIDIRTIVSLVCREKKVRNNVMTWILLNLPLDQILMNEVLITCCQQGKIHHVKYIVHEVDSEKLDIKETFVKACREYPMFQRKHFQSLGAYGLDLHKIKYDGPSYLMIVDYLFQITNDKDSYLSLVVSEIFEKTKFELILYFLREGYCRNTNMKNLLKEACISGYVRLMQWILGNVEHKELDIRSAFLEACVCRQQTCINLSNKIVNHVTCLALMWHYIHDINMFEIDTVLKTITDSQSFTSDDELKTWLLYMKSIKQRICKSNSALLNTEEIMYQR